MKNLIKNFITILFIFLILSAIFALFASPFEKEKETFLRSLIDLFSLPIIQVGRWLSNQWDRYNAVTILFNSLLDMPFQLFVEFLEEWRSFLREKREKIH